MFLFFLERSGFFVSCRILLFRIFQQVSGSKVYLNPSFAFYESLKDKKYELPGIFCSNLFGEFEISSWEYYQNSLIFIMKCILSPISVNIICKIIFFCNLSLNWTVPTPASIEYKYHKYISPNSTTSQSPCTWR